VSQKCRQKGETQNKKKNSNTECVHGLMSNLGIKAAEDKKVAAFTDTFVAQYGSHFSNPEELRRLKTARPKPTSNQFASTTMRSGGKKTAAEALNIVMSERSADPRSKYGFWLVPPLTAKNQFSLGL